MEQTNQTNETQALETVTWGADLRPEDRPGVPRDSAPHPLAGTHWTEPPQQPVTEPILLRAGLDCPTPVFSTALPPKGIAGAMRAMAYRVPDHLKRHWALLLFADRVEALVNLPNWVANRNALVAKPAAEPTQLQAAA